MVTPIVEHHCKVYPLQGHPSDLSNQIWTRPYLLIQWVVSSIASVEMEASIFPRDLVSHGTFKGTAVDQGHSELLGVVVEMVTSKVVGLNDSDTHRLYRIKRKPLCVRE